MNWNTCATCIYAAPDNTTARVRIVCVNYKSLHYAVRVENIYSFGCSQHKPYIGGTDE